MTNQGNTTMALTGAKNPIDAYVGQKIKERRALVGVSQTVLATKLGITFQQVQKYEKGANRVGSSRLYEIAQILDVPLQSFFEGVEDVVTKKNMKKADKNATDPSVKKAEEFAASTTGAEIMKAFGSIEDPKVKKRLVALVKGVAEDQQS